MTGCSTNSSRLNSTKGYVKQLESRVLEVVEDDGDGVAVDVQHVAVVDDNWDGDDNVVVVEDDDDKNVNDDFVLVAGNVVVALNCAKRKFNFGNIIKTFRFSLSN